MSNQQDHINQIKALQKKILEMDKLASLGTLSAGILHEIQNPMNFILNFSKMSKDLLEELTEFAGELTSISADDREELQEISNLIADNLNRVLEHSQRANDIVKGMLAYSRGQKAEKTIVQVNRLISKFVNLGYHAMRANHKGFNVKITEHYDDAISEVKAIEHDLGRAVLNLVNNACYAVFERAREAKEYQPELTITTGTLGKVVKIDIRDNGIGMPGEVIENMYKPFFSTKPEQSGTGLGLTITREIIEDRHQGKLEVISEPGEGTAFTILLPINE